MAVSLRTPHDVQFAAVVDKKWQINRCLALIVCLHNKSHAAYLPQQRKTLQHI